MLPGLYILGRPLVGLGADYQEERRSRQASQALDWVQSAPLSDRLWMGRQVSGRINGAVCLLLPIELLENGSGGE